MIERYKFNHSTNSFTKINTIFSNLIRAQIVYVFLFSLSIICFSFKNFIEQYNYFYLILINIDNLLFTKLKK